MEASTTTSTSTGISWPLNRPTQPGLWDPASSTANGHAHTLAPPPAYAPYSPPPNPIILPSGRHSLSRISSISSLLGLALGLSISLMAQLLYINSPLWRTPFFLAILSIFHFFEFFVTAKYNTRLATPDSFLLTNNGMAYNIAHGLAFLETTITHSILPYPSIIPVGLGPYVLCIGLTLLILGQFVRSMAMVQAGTNFNHRVQTHKAHGHELVTSGIYAFLRHPSYFGFFWWGVGSQIILGNGVCCVGYAVVLWKFFHGRIESK